MIHGNCEVHEATCYVTSLKEELLRCESMWCMRAYLCACVAWHRVCVRAACLWMHAWSHVHRRTCNYLCLRSPLLSCLWYVCILACLSMNRAFAHPHVCATVWAWECVSIRIDTDIVWWNNTLEFGQIAHCCLRGILLCVYLEWDVEQRAATRS